MLTSDERHDFETAAKSVEFLYSNIRNQYPGVRIG